MTDVIAPRLDPLPESAVNLYWLPLGAGGHCVRLNGRLYEAAAAPLLVDPWAARDAYIEVLLDRSPERVTAFLARHARGNHEAWNEAERARASKLLELERQTLLMYTSCGWFFNDLAGIETVQVLRYAGRAVQLAQELFGDGFEERFLARLGAARSNRSEEGDGRRIYERHVRPAAL